MRAVPPLLAGALQETMTDELPLTAAIEKGESATREGVALLAGAGSPSPVLLLATTT